MIRRKKRAFKKGGKTQNYHNKATRAEGEVLLNKVRFFDKIKQKIVSDKNVKGYYNAIKLLQSDETPKQWDIASLFPGKTNFDIANKCSDFFNAISREFEGLPPPDQVDTGLVPPTTDQIRRRIIKMRKPKGEVRGDIDSRLLGRFPAALAVPLKIIFSQIYKTSSWPDLWKKETVTLIPKNRSPNALSQLRNISCTPFFSKLLETFMLDGLKEDVALSDSQFGGKKRQGVDHMLIETWDEIHKGLEGGATAVNIMAVDYEKAFNRLDHRKCVESLRELGAKDGYIRLVHAFLFDRKMTVKVRDSFSTPRTVTGGAPQGSISGGFLFCATVNRLLSIEPVRSENLADLSSSSSETPPSPIPFQGNDSYGGSDDEVNGFFQWFRPRRIEDSRMSEDLNNTEIREILDIEQADNRPVVKGYIDDFNVIETLDDRLKITHHTTGKTTSTLRAPGCESIFEQLGDVSTDLGMKINPNKTQLLCISSTNDRHTQSFIRVRNQKIRSGGELKILGFWFDETPTVKLHVNKTLAKARSRLVSLRTLKRSGLSEPDLLKTYTTYIRPLLDYAAPTYHPQLTVELASELERFQAKAMKIVYGPLVAYQTVLEHDKICSHQSRRQALFENFARKSYKHPTFNRRWFPPRQPIDYNLRNREQIAQPTPRTNRYQKSPILAMRTIINKNP